MRMINGVELQTVPVADLVDPFGTVLSSRVGKWTSVRMSRGDIFHAWTIKRHLHGWELKSSWCTPIRRLCHSLRAYRHGRRFLLPVARRGALAGGRESVSERVS